MAASGKFIINKFKGQRLDLFLHLDSEWLKYADGDAQSYTVIIAIPIDYDEESGVLTFHSETGNEFYIDESFIQMFWKSGSGFSLVENTNSTLYGSKKKNRDIM
jgi:hypothetical protein